MTTPDPIFVLDANVFIEAARRYYPLDFAMPFWNFLERQARNQRLCSIDRVLDELRNGDDLLKDWAVDTFSPYFLNTQDPQIILAYQEIVRYVQNESQYSQRAKDVFMNSANADTWILAFARSQGATIVTHEVLSSDAKKRVPIPNVCEPFNIDYCDSFAMLRRLNFSF